MSNEHLKISLSMFIVRICAQYGIKLVELGSKLAETRNKIQWDHTQISIIKIKYIMNDFRIFLYIGGVGIGDLHGCMQLGVN
jgi:hypothetical protein